MEDASQIFPLSQGVPAEQYERKTDKSIMDFVYLAARITSNGVRAVFFILIVLVTLDTLLAYTDKVES